MTARRDRSADEEINYYIAFTDLAFTLVLVLVLVVVLVTLFGRIGWDEIKYKEAQAKVKAAVEQTYAQSGTAAPNVNVGKNDPPGAQRWVFAGAGLFDPGSARLSPSGRADLLRFADVVRANDDLWRRLRIEGHTLPPREGERDDWRLSAERAEQVARVFSGAGHIPAFKMAIAGRAGQNPLLRDDKANPANERVEILIEYSIKAR